MKCSLFGVTYELDEAPYWVIGDQQVYAGCPFCGDIHMHSAAIGDGPLRQIVVFENDEADTAQTVPALIEV